MSERRKSSSAGMIRTPKRELPDVHPDLAGFDVQLNRFGEVDMTISIDKLNEFLDREVSDPKLRQWGLSDEPSQGEN